MGPTPLQGRQISPDHARAIAENGGSIGIWHFFPSLDRYVDGLKEMAEIVGVDHVSIGTDQHVTPEACRTTRNGWILSPRCCAAALRRRKWERSREATICASFALPSADACRSRGGRISARPAAGASFALDLHRTVVATSTSSATG
jgi:microsomal dipeptidase-like Zn-dependent dipeptidase